mgnify:CR=1 FL=1
MADTLKFRGGSTSDIASSTVSDREIVFDTDKNTLVLGSAKDYLMRYGGNSQSGNVGIGVASPSTALDVSGTVTATAFAGPVTGNLTGNVTGPVTGNLTGNVTGNVTGNLTGDVTGNLTGNVTGPVTGNLTGNVTGNLTGDVTGNVTGNLTGNVTNDTVIISAGSTERLRINSSGNVGIGTTDPSKPLEISSSTDATIRFNDPATVGAVGRYIGGLEYYTNDSSGGAKVACSIKGYHVDISGNGSLEFATGAGVTAMTIDGSQRVGIGTTSPVGRLDVATAGDSSIVLSNETTYTDGLKRGRITKKADNSLVIQACDSASPVDTVFLRTTSAETMRIDSIGRLLIATSASRVIGGYSSVLQLEGAQNYTNSSISLVHNRTDSGGPEFRFAKSRGTTTGSNTSVARHDNLGTIFFHGADGTDAQSQAGRISCQVDGTPGGNDMPGRLTFYTTADGASTPTERLRINSNGNVGIGTDSPTYLLTVGETTPEGITSKFSQGADTNFQLVAANGTALNSDGQEVSRFGIHYRGSEQHGPTSWNSYLSFIRGAGATTGSIAFATSQQEAFRIDSEGRLLVGTSSALSVDSVTAGVEVNGTATNSGASLSIARFRDDNSPPQLTFGKSRNATIAAGTIVQNGDALGQIVFSGDDGTDLNTAAARIQAFVDGTPGANDMPGRLVFSTTSDGASGTSERMRITNDGSVLLNTAGNIINPITGTVDGAYYDNSVKQLILSRANGGPLVLRRRSSNGALQGFYRDGNVVGTIAVTATNTAYNTSSDYRLKENVTPVTDGITRLQQLKPSRFNFIADPDTVVDGFLAHEVQTIVPEAITGEKDAVDDDGNPEYQGIDQSKIVPLLTAALQEAIAKIEVLEQRLSDAGIA